METLVPLISICVIVAAIVASIFCFLLPFFVYGIYMNSKKIELKLRETHAMLAVLTDEQEKANHLSRQLLRSYGHDPAV
jgi:hypothetical protein